jgi:hypothetical protein
MAGQKARLVAHVEERDLAAVGEPRGERIGR